MVATRKLIVTGQTILDFRFAILDYLHREKSGSLEQDHLGDLTLRALSQISFTNQIGG